ncbi:MAG TPA: hypothetical protein VEY08_09795 [Chloroflexia bacterium]|nr:hypothetical protein [Chloroflexia bacterium]
MSRRNSGYGSRNPYKPRRNMYNKNSMYKQARPRYPDLRPPMTWWRRILALLRIYKPD